MPIREYVKVSSKGDLMYRDEIFEKALKEVKDENFKALKEEISTMETKIDRFLQNFFESSTFKAERDFNISAV